MAEAKYAEIDNRNYQKALAESLIASLGQDGAIHACYENLWHGVLEYLLNSKPISNPGRV